jgi:hypothetical protein
VALDPRTGTILWEGPGRRGENAWLLAADDTVIVVETAGEMIVLDAKASTYTPRATYELSATPIWAHPALFDRRLLIKDASKVRLWAIPIESPSR